MRKNNGSMTIEASIVLFLFIFAFLFFMSFAKYSQVQNKVKHSLNQTVISMSARNNQIVQLSNVIKNAIGIDASTISEWNANINEILKAFDKETHIDISGLTPYTSSTSYYNGDSASNWDTEHMKREIIRFFAYYYIDLPFKSSDKMTYDEIVKKLYSAGLEDVDITGGNTETEKVDEKGIVTRKNSFVNGNTLSITIKYKIRTGFSFGSIFGFDDDIEFSDSISVNIMK